MRKEGLESRTEIDVPAPEFTEERLRILVVMRSEFAVFAGVFVHCISVIPNTKITKKQSISPATSLNVSINIYQPIHLAEIRCNAYLCISISAIQK